MLFNYPIYPYPSNFLFALFYAGIPKSDIKLPKTSYSYILSTSFELEYITISDINEEAEPSNEYTGISDKFFLGYWP